MYALLKRKLPSNCESLRSFTILCIIGNSKFKWAMLDLGLSINIMPFLIYAALNLGELRKTSVIV